MGEELTDSVKQGIKSAARKLTGFRLEADTRPRSSIQNLSRRFICWSSRRAKPIRSSRRLWLIRG